MDRVEQKLHESLLDVLLTRATYLDEDLGTQLRVEMERAIVEEAQAAASEMKRECIRNAQCSYEHGTDPVNSILAIPLRRHALDLALAEARLEGVIEYVSQKRCSCCDDPTSFSVCWQCSELKRLKQKRAVLEQAQKEASK
jgi:hypothetical protein